MTRSRITVAVLFAVAGISLAAVGAHPFEDWVTWLAGMCAGASAMAVCLSTDAKPER
jgi:hypothetical protein